MLENSEGQQSMQPQNMLLCIFFKFFSCSYWKSSKCRERLSLNSLYLPKDRFSKRNSTVISPLPRSFINQGRLTFATGEETRQALPQIITPPTCSSKCPAISPKNHSLPAERATFPSSFSIKMVFKSEF